MLDLNKLSPWVRMVHKEAIRKATNQKSVAGNLLRGLADAVAKAQEKRKQLESK